MTTQVEKAARFRDLHVASEPLVLTNIWDAGSAKTVADAGARAVATSSWAVAGSKGLPDGEAVPLEDAVELAERLVRMNDLPVTIDFEGGYAVNPDDLRDNVARLIRTGIIGFNLEDQVVGSIGLYSIEEQAARLRSARAAADAMNIPIFINARTDLFLKNDTGLPHDELIAQTVDRAVAYREAGADGFFAPGLTDLTLIGELANAIELPLNVMVGSEFEDAAELGALGVARISSGPALYIKFMDDLGKRVATIAG